MLKNAEWPERVKDLRGKNGGRKDKNIKKGTGNFFSEAMILRVHTYFFWIFLVFSGGN